MYPDWPRSAADLVPLPRRGGPRLKPFDFQGGPQQVEFLEYLGEGLHAHVLKVKILGRIYALKLFRFVYDSDWLYSPDVNDFKYLDCSKHFDGERRGRSAIDLSDMPKDLEMLSTFYDYSEPFSCECRAFGRLQETGHEDLSVRCYGYLLLDEAGERVLTDRFQLDFNGDIETVGDHDLRSRFISMSASGKPPPIRGIVKEFGQTNQDLHVRDARLVLKDIIKMQQLGIIGIDVRHEQIVDGKLADFSKAVTTPHYVVTPELNPHLTPEWISALELETFQYSVGDYWDFDDMIDIYNDDYPEKQVHGVQAIPQTQTKYNLRKTTSRARPYSLVDPRLFDWRTNTPGGQKRPAKGGNQKGISKKDISKKGSNQKGISKKDISKKKAPVRLRAMPPRWWYDNCDPPWAARLNHARCWSITLEWVYRDGLIFPVKRQW